MTTIKTIMDLKVGDVFITTYNDFPIQVTVESIIDEYVVPVDKSEFTLIRLLSYEVIRSVRRKPTKRVARRYYLHQRVKPFARYSSKQKTCFVPFDKQEEISTNKWIIELRDQFGYSLQLTL